MPEYAFDITLTASIRVNAPDEEQARRLLRGRLDCADTNFGAWPDGTPITAETSLLTIDYLYEIDGEEV